MMPVVKAIQTLIDTLLPRQPGLAAWLAVTVACVCIFSFVHSRNGSHRSSQGEKGNWAQRLAAGLAKGLAFAGLALLVFTLLQGSYDSFNSVHAAFLSGGSLSNRAWAPWHAVYGEPLIQRELEVLSYRTETRAQPVLKDQPNQPDRYVDEEVSIPVEQNSITAFTGRVTLDLLDPEHQEDAYNAFALSALYRYEVTNPSDQPVHTTFRFPLDDDRRLFRDLQLRRNGAPLEDWEVSFGNLFWRYPMQPGQVDTIEIQYTTWGMNGYTYMLEKPRQVSNFELALAFETDNH